MRPLLLLSLALSSSGCGQFPKREPVTYQEVGHLVRIESVPTAWSETRRSKVVTDRGSFIVYGDKSGLTGAPVQVSPRGFLYINGRHGSAIVGTGGLLY